MTRVFTDGAEFGDGLFFELGNAQVTSGKKRTGNYAYQSQAAMGSVPCKLLTPHMSDFYLRWCENIDWFDSVHGCGMLYGQHVGTQVFGIFVNADQKVQIAVGDTVVATGTYTFIKDYWHLVDIHVSIATSGSIEVKLDGVLDCWYYGDTRGNSETQVDRFTWGSGGGLGFYPYSYFDDIALNDTSGSADNSWCGDGHVEMLTPNAEGDVHDWTPSSGSVHYQMVDDFPPDADSTYVGTLLPNKQEMFGLTPFNDANKLVRRAFAEIRARDMSAVGQVVKLGVKTGGGVYLCADSRVLSYNYTRVVGDEMLVNPTTGAAWEKSALDELQFVVNSENIAG